MFTVGSPSQSTSPKSSTAVAGKRRLPRLRLTILAVMLFAAASVTAQKLETQETLSRRYPFDPACAWGRIGNGKGMIVRCLTEEEANGILRRTVTPGVAQLTTNSSGSPPGTGGASAAPPSGTTPPETAEVDSEPSVSSDERLEVTVGPVTADQGELSLGKLAQPKPRYAKCVTDHGGLKDKSGEVHVRFLVRSKGVAEGVSVQKRLNVSPEAARCVAEIVDRRRVGIPDAPLVGATVVVKFERASK